jgi:hypothetical protein
VQLVTARDACPPLDGQQPADIRGLGSSIRRSPQYRHAQREISAGNVDAKPRAGRPAQRVDHLRSAIRPPRSTADIP